MVVSHLATHGRAAGERPHILLLVTEGTELLLHHSLWLHLSTRCQAALEAFVAGESLEDVAHETREIQQACQEADRRLIRSEDAAPLERGQERGIIRSATAGAAGGLAAILAVLYFRVGFASDRKPDLEVLAHESIQLQVNEATERLSPLESRIEEAGIHLEEHDRALSDRDTRLADLERSRSRESERLGELAAELTAMRDEGWSLGIPLFTCEEPDVRVPFSLPVRVRPGTRLLKVVIRLPEDSQGIDTRLEGLTVVRWEDGRRRPKRNEGTFDSDSGAWLIPLPSVLEDQRFLIEGTLLGTGCVAPAGWASLWVQPLVASEHHR
jgi:hypothetical protein